MGTYQIGDVERLLQVKAHVLRYWEKEVPLLQVRKDLGGRRVYNSRDIRILLRLKYLIYERHFTLEGARDELLRELTGPGQDLRAELDALRSQLLDLYSIVTQRTTQIDEPLQSPE
ncbi:MerR family transcriptional regulator [Gracilinema caldarium]|uniref:Regulatory protein MerR n=1 Tax=Gracilinema caldarium (strain ATCC 51460 / DSM 7334 / H1) TaxID=744872 RepID=F8EXZ9_GRAC1|nr:MerR family transcriptional regulator [Gracilinema caldarium]AEJ20660.1 regulatory protein MerR [Gracilinema caldarium DSM 7334]